MNERNGIVQAAWCFAGTLRPSAGLLAVGFVLVAVELNAVGLRLPNQDPEGIARGNAFVATADNPSAVYYNPAGITQLPGDQVRVGLYLISADTEYSSPLGKAHTDSSVQAVPQLYYTHSWEDAPFAAGLGVYAPYGLGMEWEGGSPFPGLAEEGQLLYATVNPIVAWRVNEKLSIAIGPTFNYGDADLQNAAFQFEGDDFGVGFTAGILWQPCKQWSFGAKYHSATELTLNGNSDFPTMPGTSASTEAEAHFPQFVDFGVSFRPTTNWNFEINLDWTDWDSLDQIVFDRPGVITDVPFPFNYRSSWMYEFGVTRQLGNGWFVSVGYIFSENSSPDQDFNPIVPDSDLHLGSLGIGHRGERWDWAFGYHFAYGERTVKGHGAAPPGFNPDGEYKTFNNAFNLSATFKF